MPNCQTGLGPEGTVVDADRRLVYVATSRSRSLTVLDLDRLEWVGDIPVGREPTDVIFDSPSQRVFVCDLRSSTISVIDLERQCPLRTVEAPGDAMRRRA